MAKMKAEDILKRASAAWGIKQQWHGIYDDAYSLALPQRNQFNSKAKGQVKNDTVYDSTLQKSTVKLAGMLQSTITPPFTDWFKLVPGPFLTEGRDEAEKKLDEVTKIVQAAMQPSNFDVSVGEFYLDLIIGTSAMLVLEGNDVSPFKFIAVPIEEYALEEGPDSAIGAVFRKYSKPARTIPQMWPDMNISSGLKKVMMEDPGKQVGLQEITFYDVEDDIFCGDLVFGQEICDRDAEFVAAFLRLAHVDFKIIVLHLGFARPLVRNRDHGFLFHPKELSDSAEDAHSAEIASSWRNPVIDLVSGLAELIPSKPIDLVVNSDRLAGTV